MAGNALFLILIAVALFATLSYAITRSGRSNSAGIKNEQAALDASQIIDWVGMTQFAYNKLVVSGVNPYSVDIGSGGTPCTTGVNCLWAPEGGGAALLQMPPRVFEYGVPYYSLDNPGALTGFNQPIIVYVNSLKGDALCQQLQKLAGLGSYNPSPGFYSGAYLTCFGNPTTTGFRFVLHSN